MNQEDLVLKDIERCKKVQPIMERLGIKEDDTFLYIRHQLEDGTIGEDWYLDYTEVTESLRQNAICILTEVPTYRQDRLALALPDWCFIGDATGYGIIDNRLDETSIEVDDVISFLNNIKHQRGKAQLEATADLLILLEEQQLLKKEKKI